MSPAYEHKGVRLFLGDCLELMRQLPAASVDSVVTDPPYGIRFMGKAWDGADIEERAERRRSFESHAPDAGPNGGHKSMAAEAGTYELTPDAMRAFQDFSLEWAREAFRVLKPGGFLLSFSSARTYHRMASGIEDAGFEIRDQIMWVFGSGFPKSRNLSKMDFAGTEAAATWDGWGTALKPAHEPICMARKPMLTKKMTVAENVLLYGTGAINIDACRIQTDDQLRSGAGATWEAMHRHEGRGRDGEGSADRVYEHSGGTDFRMPPGQRGGDSAGRFPANFIHDGSECVVALFPAQAGAAAPVRKRTGEKFRNTFSTFTGDIDEAGSTFHGDSGSAARFFYCAKASRRDRNEGCEHMERKPLHWSSGEKNPGSFQSAGTDKTSENNHPTVKPTDLMAYLCKLVTPPGGVVLDPFMGSGSTGKACVRDGFQFTGFERDEAYLAISVARITHEHSLPRQQRMFA